MSVFKGAFTKKYYSDGWVEQQAIRRCEAEKKFDSTCFDEKQSIYHHKMTIALAMPESKEARHK